MNFKDEVEFFKIVTGKKLSELSQDEKERLSKLHKSWGNFTNTVARRFDLEQLRNGNWNASGTVSKFLWNRYKLKTNDETNLVIVFNFHSEYGIFSTIGLIENNLTEHEKPLRGEIYNYIHSSLVEEKFDGFKEIFVNGENIWFVVDDLENIDSLDFSPLISRLKEVYFVIPPFLTEVSCRI